MIHEIPDNIDYTLRYANDIDLEKIMPDWRADDAPNYVKQQNEEYGNYYNRLEESIKKEGVKVPFILYGDGGNYKQLLRCIAFNIGRDYCPFKNNDDLLNNSERFYDMFWCCGRGGSRYYTCIKVGIEKVPAIILDFQNNLTQYYPLKSTKELLNVFPKYYRNNIYELTYYKDYLTYTVGNGKDETFR